MAALHPPFLAQDMNGLYQKVTKGIYARIPKQYSNDLQQLIAQMLTVDPKNRPSAWQVLQMSCSLRRSGQPKQAAIAMSP
jgi:NIMA (never in mitosis gene a)-related kinase